MKKSSYENTALIYKNNLNRFGKLESWPVLLTLAGALALAGCSSESSAEKCAEFNSTIDRNIMEIAVSEVEGGASDKSAVQQSARLAQNNNRLSTITINVLLQAQNKCQPRQKPIDTSIYTSQALSCYLARIEQMSTTLGYDKDKFATSKAKVISTCDFKAWNLQTPK